MAFLVSAMPLLAAQPARAEIVRNIVFPVIGAVSYSNDFGDPRSGRTHEGNDLMGKKMQQLVSAVDGTVRFIAYPQPSWGYSVWIRDSEGYEYRYLHMNNDNPGTDDGVGGPQYAYAPGISEGAKVSKGQLIGWMGDSGNAESTGAHLHFEIRQPDRTPINPYQSLLAAQKVSTAIPAPAQDGEILPYGEFAGGAFVASGIFDASGKAGIVTGAGPGGGPHVRIFKSDGTAIGGFFAYATTFRGGVDVAAGDVDGDGIDEIITGAGPSGGPHIRIFKLDGTPVGGFFAYASTFRGGVRVAAADMDGDGRVEIITGPGTTGGPHVRIFKSTGVEVKGFFAYASNFYGGIDVTAYKATSNSPATIITGPGLGGGPHIKTFDINGVVQSEFFAYEDTFRGGVNVSAGPNRIVTAPAKTGPPTLKMFSLSGNQISSSNEFEPWWNGGFDITFAPDGSVFSSGVGRRVSVRVTDL